MNDQIQPLLDTLNGLVTSSLRVGGNVFIDEEQFVRTMTALKLALQEIAKAALRSLAQGGSPESFPGSFRTIDDLEQCVENGRRRVFGRVLVDRQEYLERLEAVSTALGRNNRYTASASEKSAPRAFNE